MNRRRSQPAHRAVMLLSALAVIVASCGSSDDERSADSIDVTTIPTVADTTVADDPHGETEDDAAPTTQVATTTAASTTPDTTTPDITTADTTAAPARECRVVTDFDGTDEAPWVVVNDGVMGGRSEGAIEFTESAIRFSGTVVTAGGGFTSIRRPVDGALAGADRLELRIRPDARAYGVTLRSDATVGNRFVSYDGDIGPGPVEGDGYQVVTVAFGDLRPTVFGSPVDAPPFDPDAASELGIIIADGVDGDFEVEIDWIDACA